MALLNLQIFALAPEHTQPLSPTRQFEVFEEFTGAVIPLLEPTCRDTTPSTVVLGCAVTPYEGGALITVVCMAASADTATDEVARPLEAVMDDGLDFFEDWTLHAGEVRVTCADN
ncbi:hypothetical protein [Nocardiopsis synnemataformans]|uniref:hypothetical protein n=1 Tax=Nocardiopsis synnemataformans TaxID=61305 RepID=UPI003EC0EE5B